MGDAVLAANARLRAKIARIRPMHAARWRFRSYVTPIGLVAGALFVSAELGRQPGDVLMMMPLLTAAIYSRVLCGITAARISVALIMPVALWESIVTWNVYAPSWAPCLWLGLIGLCINRARTVRYERAPDRQSAPGPVHTPGAYRARIR